MHECMGTECTMACAYNAWKPCIAAGSPQSLVSRTAFPLTWRRRRWGLRGPGGRRWRRRRG